MDLRYLNKGRYSFVAIAHLTLDIFDCYKIHINYDANIGENLI